MTHTLLAGAFSPGEGFMASISLSKALESENLKNKAEQPLRGRFAERHFPTCKLYERRVIWELLAPGSIN